MKKMNILKKAAILFSAITVLSCSDITETSIEKAYIKLTVTTDGVESVTANERTALPDISGTDLSNFVLTGVYTDEDTNETSVSQNIGSWSTLTQLQEAAIAVSKGDWTFTLTANCGGTTLEGTLSKRIYVGDNSLSFSLRITDRGNGNGGFAITLSYADAENASSVSYATATLENLNGSSVTGFNAQTLTPSNGTVSYSVENVPVGAYWAKIKLFAESGAEMAFYRDIVQISTGCISTDAPEIENLNALYSVTYHLNNGTLPEGTTLQATVTRKSVVNLPALTRENYSFGGWYTDEDCTDGNEIECISNAEHNIDVYAKWN